MTNALIHRGPDDVGAWVDPESGIALGHRRLAVVDLSSQGHQPMTSSTGRYVIVFNGEIYNHLDLRRELSVCKSLSLSSSSISNRGGWRGRSDTEVMLEAVEQWGVENALIRFNGMFSFALWDTYEHVLYLALDRFGEKPLYFGWNNNVFLFGSELKSLKAYPAWNGEINRDALALYMRHNYIPAPYSIYAGISKLMPGHFLRIPLLSILNSTLPQSRSYWSSLEIAKNGVRNQFGGSVSELTDELDVLLNDAVKLRMAADVPLGAFLSGGIDSATVVALMQNQSSRPIKTFTIGFHENSYNEATYALAVAKHLGTDHAEFYVNPSDAMEVISRLPYIYDEPFADSSQIPTYLVSQITRQHVTVALSGDGGDELFGGYERYFLGRDIWSRTGWIPTSVRRAISRRIMAFPPVVWSKTLDSISPILPNRYRHALSSDKIQKLCSILESSSPEALYKALVTFWDPESVLFGSHELLTSFPHQDLYANIPDFAQRMMFLDLVTYLPGDILAKIDRASMSVSLETRIPMLDHRVVEFAWRCPINTHINKGVGKSLLRNILNRYVPIQLFNRPKMGFGVPLETWLRGPLRDWAENLLAESRLRKEGFFNPHIVRTKWDEHQSGKRNWASQLWTVLMFQAWLESQSNRSLSS